MLHAFQGSDGELIYGGLISDSSGNLYGTAADGGPNQGGTVYELTPSNNGWTFKLLYSLTGSASEAGPVGILAMDSNGNLYGTTNGGGNHLYGNVFKLTRAQGNWSYTDLHDFEGNDGMFPGDGPTLDASGNLFGTAGYGGSDYCSDGCGTLWEITP